MSQYDRQPVNKEKEVFPVWAILFGAMFFLGIGVISVIVDRFF